MAPKGVAELKGCHIRLTDRKMSGNTVFELYHPNRRCLFMYADGSKEMQGWVRAITHNCEYRKSMSAFWRDAAAQHLADIRVLKQSIEDARVEREHEQLQLTYRMADLAKNEKSLQAFPELQAEVAELTALRDTHTNTIRELQQASEARDIAEEKARAGLDELKAELLQLRAQNQQQQDEIVTLKLQNLPPLPADTRHSFDGINQSRAASSSEVQTVVRLPDSSSSSSSSSSSGSSSSSSGEMRGVTPTLPSPSPPSPPSSPSSICISSFSSAIAAAAAMCSSVASTDGRQMECRWLWSSGRCFLVSATWEWTPALSSS